MVHSRLYEVLEEGTREGIKNNRFVPVVANMCVIRARSKILNSRRARERKKNDYVLYTAVWGAGLKTRKRGETVRQRGKWRKGCETKPITKNRT